MMNAVAALMIRVTFMDLEIDLARFDLEGRTEYPGPTKKSDTRVIACRG